MSKMEKPSEYVIIQTIPFVNLSAIEANLLTNKDSKNLNNPITINRDPVIINENDDFVIIKKSLEDDMKKDASRFTNIIFSDKNVEDYCRICLLPGKTESVFKLKFDKVILDKILENIFSLKVTNNDVLQKICPVCYKEIIKSYIFHKNCNYSTEILKNKILSKEVYEKPSSPIQILKEIEFNEITVEIISNDEVNEITFENDETNLKKSENVNKSFQCETCSKSFSILNNLKRHKKIHTGIKPHVCNVCGKGFTHSSNLSKHKKIHEKDKSGVNEMKLIYCEKCSKVFKRKVFYEKHLRIKHYSKELFEQKEEEMNFICEICNKAFKRKQNLKLHQQVHGERKYLCVKCGKSFATKPAHDSHFKVHLEEKPYKCQFCEKSFRYNSSYSNHKLLHTGEKPHSCKFCPKKFTQYSHLIGHIRTHNGERPYSCSYCGKCFALKCNLNVHVRMHTGETPHVCKTCNRGFYESSGLKKHIKSKHGMIVESLKKKV